jgi:hypothetical protein
MPQIDIRRRLEEILARYELEPSLKDLYVEGSNDCSLVRWFLQKKGKRDIHVYQIDTVELPSNLFQKSKLNEGSNHNKIILLSEILSGRFSSRKLKVRCIADADYDRYLKICRQNYLLDYTDYTCMEMYLFNNVCIGKFLNFVLSNFPISAQKLVLQLSTILQRIFLMRLANEKLIWNMSCVDLKGYTSWNGKRIKFDEKQFLRSYLMKNRKISKIDDFQATVKEFEGQLQSDVRHNISGHDFTYLFFLTLKREGSHRFGFREVNTFEKALCGFAELDDIKNEELFVKLGSL